MTQRATTGRAAPQRAMSPRAWRWVGMLALADALSWVLTLRAQSQFHAVPGGAATTLGIVIGWIASVVLLIATVLIVLAARQARAYQRANANADSATAAAAPPATGAAGGAA